MSDAQASAAAAPTTYTIDSAHTSAHFKVRHMMISNVRGEFGMVTGTVRYDPKHPEASDVVVEIDVNSINTREPQRDAHLKSADFLDVANHPAIRFQSAAAPKPPPKLAARTLASTGIRRSKPAECLLATTSRSASTQSS